MSNYHVAQINIARMLAPIDDPIMAEFVAQLAPVNALADESPGFVWRLQSEAGDATSIKVYDDDMIIVNLTVWESVDALREYVFKGAHHGVLHLIDLLRLFNCHGCLLGKQTHQFHVAHIKGFRVDLIQYLHYTDHPVLAGDERRGEDGIGDVAGAFGKILIEAFVFLHIRGGDRHAGHEHISCNAFIVWKFGPDQVTVSGAEGHLEFQRLFILVDKQ